LEKRTRYEAAHYKVFCCLPLSSVQETLKS